MDRFKGLEDKLDVEFTQFLFPLGERMTVWIARPTAIAVKARELQARGFKFEIENDEGRIWASCIHHETERYVDKYCTNGKDVPTIIDELIEEAFSKWIN